MRKTDAWRLARIDGICRQLVAVVDEGNITEDAIHHCTTDKGEFDVLVKLGWTGKKIGWYTASA